MSFTESDLTTITQAIVALGSGQRKVSATIAGDKMEYAQTDLPGLRALRNDIQNELNAANSSVNNSVLITTGKGY